MIILGITGGIGSGKSTVSKIFELLGVPVYIADIESKKLTATSPIIKDKLINLFGDDIYAGGELNKQLLASHIFSDKDKLAATNAIIHPEVDKHFLTWVQSHRDTSLVAVESAILFESGMIRLTDKSVTVYTPLEERIRRVMLRDNITKEQVMQRVNSQMSDEEKQERSDFVIYNDENNSLIEQTINIIKNLA